MITTYFEIMTREFIEISEFSEFETLYLNGGAIP
jgi:hypothetical protein